jgi:hypothetical protein
MQSETQLLEFEEEERFVMYISKRENLHHPAMRSPWCHQEREYEKKMLPTNNG